MKNCNTLLEVPSITNENVRKVLFHYKLNHAHPTRKYQARAEMVSSVKSQQPILLWGKLQL